jgi:hypothetical protein
MDKVALLIGHPGSPEEYIPGVKKDIESYKNFLLSPYGGEWIENEIAEIYEKDVNFVRKVIDKVRQLNVEFAFVVFSGHGDFSTRKSERRLYLGDEYIYESDLRNLARKQIIIIDSCAGIEEEVLIEKAIMESVVTATIEKDYRRIYEMYIESCPDQEILLYSSSKGEYSEDIGIGGLYTVSLLETIYENKKYEIFNALIAHELAREKVVMKSRNKQHPDYLATKRSGRKLPISLGII